ncbi:MAG: class I SAM-dependent methyltransferase [Pirellulaceae bacterium]
MWSPEGYLHFGYWRPYLNPFVRRPMLEEMNRFIFQHLGLADWHEGPSPTWDVVWEPCRVWQSALSASSEFHAMSISPGQIASAMQRHSAQRVTYHCGDYHTLPFEDESISGVFYLESLCHSTQPEQALNEAARVLKPGGRIVMTDGYLRRPLQQTSPLFPALSSRESPTIGPFPCSMNWNLRGDGLATVASVW